MCVGRYWTGSGSGQETLLNFIDVLDLCASKTPAVVPQENTLATFLRRIIYYPCRAVWLCN